MTPIEHLLFTPLVVGLLENTLVEPKKILGWEHSESFLKDDFENLGVAYTPLKCFTKRL
jgi:hypothetical protein